MTDRERWTVYPLLMLSLGLAVFQTGAEQQNRSPDLEQVRCKVLEIVGPDGNAKIRIGTDDAGNGLLESMAASGTLAAKLSSNPSGADMVMFDSDQKKYLLLGFDGPMIGLVERRLGDNWTYDLATVPLLLRQLRSEQRGGKSTPTEKPAKPEKLDDGNAPLDSSKPADSEK